MKYLTPYHGLLFEQSGVPKKRSIRLDDGTLWREEWMLNGKLHREDGPAIISYYTDGGIKEQQWWINDEQHREDGPAVITYYPNGNVNSESWWKENLRHRIDGPAFISYYKDGSTQFTSWYYYGERINSRNPEQEIGRRELIAGGISEEDLQILIDAGIV